jgi:hypothetical protein
LKDMGSAGIVQRLVTRLTAGIYNVRRVDDGVYRSAQPYGGHVDRLIGGFGLRALINLRGANPGTHWYENERRICDERGVQVIDLPFNSKRLPDKEKLVEVLDRMQFAPKPLLVKCSGGADRTSFVSGLYVLQSEYAHAAAGPGAIDEALAAARNQTRRWPYLHFPKTHQRWIKIFFDFYEDRHQGLSPRDWLSQVYSKGAFAEYMRNRGLAGWWKE